MKKSVLTLIVALVAVLACSAATPSKIFFVVQGSFTTIDNARAANENDAPIYKFTSGGKTMYRICPACFYSKTDAQAYARGFKQAFNVDAWVASNNGPALCVTDNEDPLTIPIRHIAPSTTVYYIVGGSFSSIDEARKYNATCPDGLEGTVIECRVNGKKMYRVAVSCYASKADAQKQVEIINALYNRGFWVCANKGLAPVAVYGVSLAGRLIWLSPM